MLIAAVGLIFVLWDFAERQVCPHNLTIFLDFSLLPHVLLYLVISKSEKAYVPQLGFYWEVIYTTKKMVVTKLFPKILINDQTGFIYGHSPLNKASEKEIKPTAAIGVHW